MISLSIFKLIILFGGIFICVMGLGQLIRKDRHRDNIIFALMLFCLGYSLILHGIYRPSEFGTLHYIIKLTSISSYLFVGPLAYFYFQIIILPEFSLQKNHFLHFITPAILALVIWAEFFIGIIRGRRIDIPLIEAIALISVVLTVIYLAIIIFKIIQLARVLIIEKAGPVLIFCILLIINGTAWCINKYFVLNVNDEINAISSILFVSMFVIGNRHPEYVLNFREELKSANYRRTYLAGINVRVILERLKMLMEEEKAFCDEDITLPGLARELDISQHQLSEILNLEVKKNFNTFINEYRIREAQKYLLQEPKRSILSIAAAVGFETSSAFYNAFNKFTGLSPSQYRKSFLLPGPGPAGKK